MQRLMEGDWGEYETNLRVQGVVYAQDLATTLDSIGDGVISTDVNGFESSSGSANCRAATTCR
jgi:hypothetical protein